MKRPLFALAAAALAMAAPLSAQAHRQWIVPSMTVLSGDDPWVTVDAAVSNELFHADHNPMRLDNLAVTAPDGSKAAVANASTGKYRSTFDVQLSQVGTYRIATLNQGLTARYKQGGQDKFWRGRADDFKTAIPADATDVKVTQAQGRNETFVTRGKPSDGALKPSGAGLELVPVTHPNDLFAGEAATFKLMLDGKPASGLDVIVLPGAARYRDETGEVKVKTGADGAFSVTWPSAGMYWINASVRDDKATVPGAARNAAYTAVVEVLKP
jgi:uncharacterized GH25 family protein